MKHVPSEWFDSSSNEHPFSHLAWFLYDHAEEIPDHIFDGFKTHMDVLYKNEFIVNEPEAQRNNPALSKQAHENVYNKIFKEWTRRQKKNRSTDPNSLEILMQENGEDPSKKPQIYDMHLDAYQVQKRIHEEYDRLVADQKMKQLADDRKKTAMKRKQKPVADTSKKKATAPNKPAKKRLAKTAK